MKSVEGVPNCSMILFHWSMWSVPGNSTAPKGEVRGQTQSTDESDDVIPRIISPIMQPTLQMSTFS
jgi:hypothetical protein